MRQALNVVMQNRGDFVNVILLYVGCDLVRLFKVRDSCVDFKLSINISGFRKLSRFTLKPKQIVFITKSTPKFS